MHFSLAKACITLLAFGQALSIARAYPGQPSTILDLNLPRHDNQLSERNDDEIAVERRAVVPALTNWGQELGTTWSGFLKEPANSEWTEDTIDEYAVSAWKQTQSGSNPLPILVAALWVPRVGVYLGTVPHGTPSGSSMSAQVQMDSRIRTQAPLLWRQTEHRTYKDTSKWHAEDMAMFVYEREEKPTGTKYPTSYMVVYGQYEQGDKVGPKPPCRGVNQAGKGIDPACRDVLKELGVTVIWC
ncbi:hypothetical protein CC86DRAFT_427631 [Ophiobolus disseminans]|uniref:Uncharacterized protein n=1 Tax=Ophiobolus disseminans TaxID=1469910 RepID=A0A6A6ZKL8_9PLEO|nr:hypothetical protein CC86DRAFT_427631 [Ophiobolus disseminans]